ncbi:MAG: hypothetical protein HY054_15535 [Proteobacteria bacterium]|nr:hypothetical protein [Pseudomonadota bacterium]
MQSPYCVAMRKAVIARICLFAFALLAIARPGSASAETLTLTCSRTASSALARVGGQMSMAQYNNASPENALSVDLDRKTMRFGGGSDMPILSNAQSIAGISDSPGQGPNGESTRALGTYIIDRASGRLRADIHMLDGETVLSLSVLYQCRTTAGSSSF